MSMRPFLDLPFLGEQFFLLGIVLQKKSPQI